MALGFPLGHPLASPLRALLGRGTAPGPAIARASMLGVGVMMTSESATSLAVPAGPGGTLANDLLLLVQYSNRIPGTPDGWTPLLSVTDAGTAQRLDLYTAPGDVTSPVTITQDSLGRLAGAVVALRPPAGKTVQVDVAASHTDVASPLNPHAMQDLTTGVAGLGLALAVTQLTGAGAQLLPSAGWTNLFPTGQFNQRLGLAWRASDAAQALAGTFTATAFATDGSVTSHWNLATLNFKV